MKLAAVLWILFYVTADDVICQPADGDLTSSLGDGIQEILVPMCRHLLSYNTTMLPNRFGHNTQVEVYRLIEHYWSFMDYGCSRNFRLFVCSLYLPQYVYDAESQTHTSKGPCKQTCMKAKKGCSRPMRDQGSRWPRELWVCKDYPPANRQNTCIRPLRERRGASLGYTYCEQNNLPTCQGLPYREGSLPNMFLQRTTTEIETELDYYQPLLNSGCSEHLRFMICGMYMPFCVRALSPFSLPCRDLCLAVHANCSVVHSLLYHGLPWPNKLQCHRFPEADAGSCVMPGDV